MASPITLDTTLTLPADRDSRPDDPETPDSSAAIIDEKIDAYKVHLEPEDDPKSISTARKWIAVFIISLGSLCVTCASSMAALTEIPISIEFNVSPEVSVLGISLYVLALGNGTLLIGPLSEIYGRRIMYQLSFLLFWIFSWPVAFAPNIVVYLVFRYFSGFCSAAFFSVAGGTISDLFINSKVGAPMGLYSLSPFIGPVLVPLVSGFINQNASWRWTYRVLIIWSFLQLVGLCLFVPETFIPLLLKQKAQRLRQSTGDDRYWAPLERESKSVVRNIVVSGAKCFQIMYHEKMALLLDIWTALILGILYLTFQAFPIIFGEGHGFDIQMTGLTFLGIGVGMLLSYATQPLWNRLNDRMMVKHDGHPPPEARLIMGQVGGVLIPVGLFWMAFTTYKQVHWIVPIIASIPFGAGICFTFTSVFTYLVVAYRPVAASAMAGNTFCRSVLACTFPLVAKYMYDRLGAVGATALLAGLTTIMAPLPFIFYKIGARVRTTSRFAETS